MTHITQESLEEFARRGLAVQQAVDKLLEKWRPCDFCGEKHTHKATCVTQRPGYVPLPTDPL